MSSYSQALINAGVIDKGFNTRYNEKENDFFHILHVVVDSDVITEKIIKVMKVIKLSKMHLRNFHFEGATKAYILHSPDSLNIDIVKAHFSSACKKSFGKNNEAIANTMFEIMDSNSEEKPKKNRRTKAEIEADEAKEA